MLRDYKLRNKPAHLRHPDTNAPLCNTTNPQVYVDSLELAILPRNKGCKNCIRIARSRSGSSEPTRPIPICGTLALDGDIDQEFQCNPDGTTPPSVRQDIQDYRKQGFTVKVKFFQNWQDLNNSY